ncbi:MAG: hypothetical protein AB7P12_01780 [Alphaproteobacteria bacterium]
MYDVVPEAYHPSSDKIGVRPPGIPAWLSQWVKSYLRACGVRDDAVTLYVIGMISTDASTDPRSLVIQIHSALARHGTHLRAPPTFPALLPAELPGAMPCSELSPAWSTPKDSEIVPSRAKPGPAWGSMVVFLMGIFGRGL